MDNKASNKSPRPVKRKSELLRAMLAIALAVASQSTMRDGLPLLGLAGFVTAALLFVSSVGAIFRASTRGEPMPAEAIDGADKLRYLRRHWRLVTIAEIFADDIPPARVGIPEAGEAATDEPDASLPVAAEMQSWTAAASPTSTPKAVRITAQGDVLVLDTGLEQVQRFNEQGSLLATYSLPGLSGVEVLDLDVSPDGKRLYVVDATSRLRVISLVDEESTGGSESG